MEDGLVFRGLCDAVEELCSVCSIVNIAFCRYHSLGIHSMPNMVLSTLHGLFHFILIITLWSRHFILLLQICIWWLWKVIHSCDQRHKANQRGSQDLNSVHSLSSISAHTASQQGKDPATAGTAEECHCTHIGVPWGDPGFWHTSSGFASVIPEQVVSGPVWWPGDKQGGWQWKILQRNIAGVWYWVEKKRKEDEAKHIRIHFKHGYKVSASEIVAVRRLLAVYSGNAFSFPGRKLSRRELFTYTFIGGSLVYLMYF